MHTLKRQLPSLYDITQPESFGTVTVIGVIKLFPVYQTTPIMNGDNTADRR